VPETAAVAGEITTAGAVGVGEFPVPMRLKLWGLAGALSAICRLPWRAPTALGVNVIPSVQLALAATAAPVQVLEASAKSLAFAPVTVTAPTFSGALPLFVIVTTSGALAAPCVVLGSIIGLLGTTVTAGVAGVRPLPLSARICGLLEASSVNCRLA
jgi:hypothetical protein